jgi:hypothetical protein
MMARLCSPRGVFINFPLGHQCGKPQDVDLQVRILKETLTVLSTATEPGQIVDLPYEWDGPFAWEDYSKDIQAMLEEQGGVAQEWKPKE